MVKLSGADDGAPEFEREFIADDGRAAEGHLAAGRVIYYRDPVWPDGIVKEYPGGRRQLVAATLGGADTVLRDLP